MKPRLASSKKWTDFPVELSAQIEDAFKQNFTQFLTQKAVQVEGRIYPEEIALRVGISEKGSIKHSNFEVSLSYKPEAQNVIAGIHTCIDVAASMLTEFIAGEEVHEFPLYWTEYPFNGQKIWLQYSSENSNLEAEADRLLGLIDDNLVKKADSEETEEALERAEIVDEDTLQKERAEFLKKKTHLH